MNFSWLRNLRYVWYYPTVMVLLIALGIFSTVYVYFKIDSFEKKSLLKRSDTLSKVFTEEQLNSLRYDETDLANSQYLSLKDKLIAVKRVNPDVHFVYLTGIKDGQIFFIADSEEPGAEGYSPPGQIYQEASADFLSIFNTKESILEGPVSDRWGSWISALSPIINPQTKEILAVVGMDIEAGSYMRTVWLYSAIPLFITLILLTLIAIGWVVKKEEEKMVELKSEFVSIASHDIRSPIGGILWTIESLQKSSANFTEDQRTTLRTIEGNCRNLLGTLNDLLLLPNLAKEKIGKIVMEERDVIELIKKAIGDLDLSAREKSVEIIFEKNIPAKLIVKCDQDKIKRVFSNILDNAIKYSKPGSKVEIDYRKEDSFHIISVKDRGIGISGEDQTKIFRGFFRAESAKQFTKSGTGLGLYYVQSVINLHKGKLWLESAENQGTTFYVGLKY